MHVRNLLAAATIGLAMVASCTDFDGLRATAPTGTRDGGPDADSGPQRADAGDGYVEEVMRDGPLAYWHFDETAGSIAADATGHGHDCAYLGAVGLNAPGAIGPAIDFTGAADTAVRCADAPFDFPALQAFSLEASVKPTVADTIYRRVFSKDDPNAGVRRGYSISVEGSGSGRVIFARFEDAKSLCAADLPITLGVYSHIVGTFDGTTISIYVNGSRATDACPSTPLTNHALPLTIGVQSDENYGSFSGSIDGAAVYDKALSPARVTAHFSASKR